VHAGATHAQSQERKRVPGLARTAAHARFGASHFQGRNHKLMSSPASTDNSEIFDLASGLDTLAVGSSPAQSFAVLDAVMAQTLGMAMFNAVNSQQNGAIVRSTALTIACTILLTLPVAGLDKAVAKTGTATEEAPRVGAMANSEEPGAAQAQAQEGRTDHPKAASPGMPDGTTSGTTHPAGVNTQVIDAINQMQTAVMDPQVVLTSGAGKAYQSVAQSAAITVQDAADALRSISTIAVTASGVAMAQFLATGDPKYLVGITAAQEMIKVATEDYTNIGVAAAAMLKGFPSG
jgi:hypothetical protein